MIEHEVKKYDMWKEEVTKKQAASDANKVQLMPINLVNVCCGNNTRPFVLHTA